MAGDSFPIKSRSGELKFLFEARMIKLKGGIKDIEVALQEAPFVTLHTSLTDTRDAMKEEMTRIRRLLPYLISRREREER
jgi:hypothetical protein